MGLIVRDRVLMVTGELAVVKCATVRKTGRSVTRKTASASVVRATLVINVTSYVQLVLSDRIAQSFACVEKVEMGVIQSLGGATANQATMAQCVTASARSESGGRIAKSTVTVETVASVTLSLAYVAAWLIGRDKSVNFHVRR